MRFLLRLLGNMLGIWVSGLWITGITVQSGTSIGETILILAGIALVLTLVNSIIKPIIHVIAFPFYLLTFGLFALVTNALVFLLAGWLAQQLTLPFTVDGFWPALLGGTLTAIISSIVVAVIGSDRH